MNQMGTVIVSGSTEKVCFHQCDNTYMHYINAIHLDKDIDYLIWQESLTFSQIENATRRFLSVEMFMKCFLQATTHLSVVFHNFTSWSSQKGL